MKDIIVVVLVLIMVIASGMMTMNAQQYDNTNLLPYVKDGRPLPTSTPVGAPTPESCDFCRYCDTAACYQCCLDECYCWFTDDNTFCCPDWWWMEECENDSTR